MARVTSKRQVTIPKAIADRYGIESGDEIEFMPAGASIRVERAAAEATGEDRDACLERYDQATERQHARRADEHRRSQGDRGWRREDLYERGSPR